MQTKCERCSSEQSPEGRAEAYATSMIITSLNGRGSLESIRKDRLCYFWRTGGRLRRELSVRRGVESSQIMRDGPPT